MASDGTGAALGCSLPLPAGDGVAATMATRQAATALAATVLIFAGWGWEGSECVRDRMARDRDRSSGCLVRGEPSLAWRRSSRLL